ncbi:integrase catalytic subunit [mine drainage metagenome]|uniref:Integrase catalytic subunit n=2 Tax=mine drainage metagenome TaxID=410659 RepID=T1CUN5_9ZZZZ
MNLYPFIEAEKAEHTGTVATACRLLEVSRSAFYEWAKHICSKREKSSTELGAKIIDIHKKSRHTYGSPRITTELANQGIAVGENRVAKVMRQLSIVGRAKRRWKKTTIADPDVTTTAVDLVKRAFGPGVREINTVWCGDITYVRTWVGWLYLATVIDLSSRRVVGFAMANHMRAELVCDALKMAIEQRQPGPGLIFHSDRGSQYTSKVFRKLMDAYGIVQSLSRPRQCWDNAVAESWFATLKEELIYRQAWPTLEHAKRAIFEYIEVFYNRTRLHSSLGYLTPVAYEEKHSKNLDRKEGQAA